MSSNLYTSEQKNIVKKLTTARLQSKLKQEDIAKLLGKTQSYISKLESGQRKIDIIQLKKIAKIYNKDVSYFTE